MSLKTQRKSLILAAISAATVDGKSTVSSRELLQATPVSPATLKRYLEELVRDGLITRTGSARATRYRLATAPTLPSAAESREVAASGFPLSLASRKLLSYLGQPLAVRSPVTYQRQLVEHYVPNESCLMPREIAASLAVEGRMQGQQPAGTYARKVLESLLIDLSWSSSRLEGNRFTLLATEELFKRGTEGNDSDAIMLLNHKRAIEFLVDAVPEFGLTKPVICNLHSLLMADLLSDPSALGTVRTKVVNISDTVYVPTQIPDLLQEMLERIVHQARLIKNPIEGAFFLWVNLAYLQPFEDGNKRTSRLATNIPLLLYNCAPLSFLDIDARDYAHAMLGVYERLDVSLAVDLFAWTYRRSIKKYGVIAESVGGPDPFRLKYRDRLTKAVQLVVRDGRNLQDAVREVQLPANDQEKFCSILHIELSALTPENCARYYLSMRCAEDWITQGRRQ